jgi:hypothetical protein
MGVGGLNFTNPKDALTPKGLRVFLLKIASK